jgi:hypothetical protein
MEKKLVKTFISDVTTDIENIPVTQGNGEHHVKLVSDVTDRIVGVTKGKMIEGKPVDVVMFGETFVNCQNAVDGSMPLVANQYGYAVQMDLQSDELQAVPTDSVFYTIGYPIDIAGESALLTCVVDPQVILK